MPIPVTVRSKAWVCGRSLTRIVGLNPTEGMDVYVVFVVRTVAWNVKWHEGRKDLNSTKMDQREKTPDRQEKKSHQRHGCLSLVSVVCCQVEVSAKGWSLVQRSPTECGVSNSVWSWNLEMRRPRHPKRGCWAIGKKNTYSFVFRRLRLQIPTRKSAIFTNPSWFSWVSTGKYTNINLNLVTTASFQILPN
jgi:hypothetical protein